METIKKYIKEKIIITVLVILLLSVSYCSHNSQKVTQGEKKQLKEQLKKEQDGLKIFREKQKKFSDSIFLAEKAKDKRITELNQSNEQLNKRLENSQKELQKKKDSYKNKNYEQLAEVFKEQGYENVTATTNSVNLEKDTPIAVLEDLAEGNACAEDIQTKNEIIKNKDEEIKITQEKVLIRDLLLASKQIEVEKLDSALDLSKEINKKSEKEIRQLKTKNFINKILVPIAFTIGGYTGYQIAK